MYRFSQSLFADNAKCGTFVLSEETVTGTPLADSDPLCDTDEPKDHPLSVPPPPPPAYTTVYSHVSEKSWQEAIPPASKPSVAYPMFLGEQHQASPKMYIPLPVSSLLYRKDPWAYTQGEWTTKLKHIRWVLKQLEQRELTREQLATKAMEVEKKEEQLVAKKQKLRLEWMPMFKCDWHEIEVEKKSSINKWKVEHEVQDLEWEWVKLEIEKDELDRLLNSLDYILKLDFSITLSILEPLQRSDCPSLCTWPLDVKQKTIAFLLVFSLATLVALLRALRSGWGPPLELALSLSNDNYWVVFVDVFADLLAFVWSNPATQYTLCTPLGVTLTISLIMNGIFVYNKIVNGDSTTQNTSFHNKLLLSQEEQCKAAVTSRWELHQALAEVGDWYGLCLGLEISDSISQLLRHSSKDVTDKKRVCLDAFYDLGEGEACWERVVRVVAGYPIHKRGLAKKLAKLVGIDFEDAVGSHSEL